VTNQQSVSPRELERTRRKVATLAERLSPEEGWIVDTATGAKVVSLFPRLSVRPGLRLVTVAARAGIGGNGWTFAIPKGFEVPFPDDLERAAAFPPEPPRGAFAHVMDAIDGDGSLRSYIQAAILRRELEELGAWWHGLEWSTHTLLDNGAAPDAPHACSDSDDNGGPLPADPECAGRLHHLTTGAPRLNAPASTPSRSGSSRSAHSAASASRATSTSTRVGRFGRGAPSRQRSPKVPEASCSRPTSVGPYFRTTAKSIATPTAAASGNSTRSASRSVDHSSSSSRSPMTTLNHRSRSRMTRNCFSSCAPSMNGR
jgi:hypothetical protein